MKITTDKALLVQEANSDVYKKQRQPNLFGVKSLHLVKKHGYPQSVYLLQHSLLITIRVAFRKVETKLKVYTQDSSLELIFDVSNKAKKNYILGRLGTTFALTLYL